MDPPKILKEHEMEIKSRFSVRKIGIFGSYVRGMEKETSDIDVLVEFEEPTFRNFMGLAFFLEELFGKKGGPRDHQRAEPLHPSPRGEGGGLV
jgi:predicted nucleotidyltransferase